MRWRAGRFTHFGARRGLPDAGAFSLTLDQTGRLWAATDSGVRVFEIDYTALSPSAPENVRFRYRLDGLDDRWVDAGTRRTAFYTNVPPGTYTFRVVASNDDGVPDVIVTDAIPLVLLRARAASTDQAAGFGAGADAYLTKPFDPASRVGRSTG